MDHNAIVIKSEDISDNEQSHSGEALYEDYDDCLSPIYIPKVRLEEEDGKLLATALRQQQKPPPGIAQKVQKQQHQQQQQYASQQHQTPNVSKLLHHSQQPDLTIRNIGGIRVRSIGSMANMMKTLENSLKNGNNNNNNTGSNNSFASADVTINSA